MPLTPRYWIILSNPIITIPAIWKQSKEVNTPSGNVTHVEYSTKNIRVVMVELDDHAKSYWGTRFQEAEVEIWTKESVKRGDLIEINGQDYEIMHIEELPMQGARRLICRRR